MTLIKATDEVEMIKFKVPDKLSGLRLDSAISNACTEISRNSAQHMIEEGYVTVNSKNQVKKKFKVMSGDIIEISARKEVPLDVEPEDIPLHIIYEDEDVVVINKTKGMVVHPAPGNPDGTLVNALLYHCKDSLSGVNGVIRPGIVHRIDKDTSGLLVVAKNDEAHRFLSAQLTDHSMEREYEAIVYNNIKDDIGTVDAPIGRDPKNRLRNKVVEGGRNAVTHYEVMERFGKYTYVRLKLKTGRTHQIRVHMSHIGHPLLGDPLYSNAKNSLGVKGQMLHARTLGFIHPKTKEHVLFESQLPEEFSRVLTRLRAQQ